MLDTIHTTMAKNGLVRGDRRWLAGVCSGLAAKTGADVALVRLLMIALLALPGSQLFVYPLLWLAMPDRARAQQLTGPASSPVGPVTPATPQDRLH